MQALDTSTASGFPLTAKDAVDVVATHAWFFIVPLILLTLAGIALALVLTPVYRSVATVSVESQQIPEALVRSTVTSNANERLDYITQRVLTRLRILDIVAKLNVYPDSSLSSSQLVKKFRNAVAIETVNANIANSRRTQVISFSLSFSSSSPKKAQSVTNELVTMFLNENVSTRSARAAQTTTFLGEEAEKIRKQVTKLEKEVSTFKQQNGAMLPEVHDMNLVLMSRLESEYQTVMLSIEEIASELKFLRIQSDQYKSNSSSDGPNLLMLRQQLSQTLIQQTDGHPDVIRLRRQIAAIESQALEVQADQEAATTSDRQILADPVYARISTQVDSATRKLGYLRKNRDELQLKLSEVENRISSAPTVERQYIDLQRDLENLKLSYQEIKNKEIEAKISQNLEEDQKGERFTLLEAAIVPSEPESPNRLLILLGSMGAAIAMGVAMIVGRELLNPGIRSMQTFSKSLGATPLVVIPDLSIQTESTQTLVAARRRIFLLVTSILVAASAILAVIIFLEPLLTIVEPLQELGLGFL